MKRSDIIALAKELILQAAGDPAWSSTEWGVIFCEAVDLFHEGLVAADLDLFVTRGATISRVGTSYPLPDDLHAVKWLEDQNGPIRPVDHFTEKESNGVGYTLQDENLILVGWYGDLPASLTLDYIREPKEIPAWTGAADPATSEYEPDFPLSTNRGGRSLARCMAILAKIKDGSNDASTIDQAKGVSDRFVDRLLSRRQFE